MDNLFYDGFNSKLIETALFESLLEIPVLETQKKIIIPSIAVPFSKRAAITGRLDEMLVFYEHDPEFRNFVSVPQNYIEELKRVEIISTPDCSLYRDMPLWEQLANIGVSRSVGFYLQQQGKYVIPNARWGDERTYSKHTFGFAQLLQDFLTIVYFLLGLMDVVRKRKISTTWNLVWMQC